MRFTYKVREISKDDNDVEDIVDLGEAEIMEAMSFKKLRAKEGRDFDFGVGKGATFILDINKKFPLGTKI